MEAQIIHLKSCRRSVVASKILPAKPVSTLAGANEPLKQCLLHSSGGDVSVWRGLFSAVPWCAAKTVICKMSSSWPVTLKWRRKLLWYRAPAGGRETTPTPRTPNNCFVELLLLLVVKG